MIRIILFVIYLITSNVYAQINVVKIASAPLSKTKLGPCEPSIAINPTNPENLVIGSILDRYHYTEDGGKTWVSGHLTSPYGVWGDPVVVVDSSGTFYYFHLSDPTGKNWKSDSILDRIVCQRSLDGGKTWDNGTYMGLNHPKQQDKEWACVDPVTQRIYVAWTQFDRYRSTDPEDKSHIMCSSSSDGGNTWTDAVQVSRVGGNCLDDGKTAEGTSLQVDQNGDLHIVWSRNDTIWHSISQDSGQTFTPERMAAKQPGGWSFAVPGVHRCNGFPVLAIDRKKNRLILTWSDQRNGKNNTDVFVTISKNNGKSWSKPKRVHRDPTNRHQFFHWTALDSSTGHLYTVYYDRRNHSGAETDVYLAWSTNSGKKWKEMKISEQPFVPTTRFFFGDYNNIVAHKGKIYAVWTAMEESELVIYVACIKESDLN